MTQTAKSIRQSLNLAFLRLKPTRAEIDLFKSEATAMLDRISDNESEEYHKNLIHKFLDAVYYKGKHFINTKDKIDLVIHTENDTLSSVGVIIETKSLKNRNEMPTVDNLNVKAFHELLLYYLRERKSSKNYELKYLIITNLYEWFVFDAQDFERLFYQDKELIKQFEQFELGNLSGVKTDFFYREIAAPAIKKVQTELPFTHFDIRDYETIIRGSDEEEDKKLVALYKFLSPTHLLKLPFANDANHLNQEFYDELLYILGLEEVTRGGQDYIERKKEGTRETASMLENAIDTISSINKIQNFDNQFDTALELILTWINRILFLKLLEAQIVKYNANNKDFAFLSASKLNDYRELNELFFSVLACKEEERDFTTNEKFANVPYLNSALFEKTDVESNYIFISNLRNEVELKLYPKSVLYNTLNNKRIFKMRPLEYLLKFLDAYDFSSEGSEDIQDKHKTLISASVLGLIFEKINGYKDGSFFTPSYITMYMCRETIERAVIQKFNDFYNWTCENIIDLHNKITNIAEANLIFNTLRICDPAVGSGHFLVSALNELIYTKAYLGILTDKTGKTLRGYNVCVENDELLITDEDDNQVVYKPKSVESQRIQETFFHEKQTLIENCLFGVDINPNSVKICQLRLWIELLKHAYYRWGTSELETLPNIDINIKCGNSLISRFALTDKYADNPTLQQKIKHTTKKYRELVSLYKHTTDRHARQEIVKQIKHEKDFFYLINNTKDADYQAWQKAKAEIALHTNSFDFSQTDIVAWNDKTQELTAKASDLEKIYTEKVRGCFEWRFEFPEILDEDGNFMGFDLVIGNPPYIQLQAIGSVVERYERMNYQVFERITDIYCLFYERGYQLLKQGGRLSHVTSNKWMRASYGKKLRNFITENTNPELLTDFTGIKVFAKATVDVSILSYQKSENKYVTRACSVHKDSIKNLYVYVKENEIISSFGSAKWLILNSIERSIKAKIEALGKPLETWNLQIYRGILTGYNEAFIISGKKRSELIAQDPKSEKIIHPILRGRDIKRYGYKFADLWLINTHNGSKRKTLKPINIDDYPAVKRHLDKYYLALEQREDKGKTPYNLRNCAYTDSFSKPKLIYPETTQGAYFAFDTENIFIDKTCFMLISKHAKYLQATLSSKLFEFAYKKIFSSIELGTSGYQYNKHALLQLPVIMPTKQIENKIIKLVDKILVTKNKIMTADTSHLEKEIDTLVYDLYGLTEEEIETIETQV